MPSLEQKKVRKSGRRFFVRTLDVHLDFFFFFFLSFFSFFFFNFHTRTGQRQNFIGQKFVAIRIYIRIIVKQFYLGDSFPKLVSASRTVFGKYLCTGLPERIRTREEGSGFH